MIGARLKTLLDSRDPAFWDEVFAATRTAHELEEVLELAVWRQRGLKKLPPPPAPAHGTLRAALLGGSSLHPLKVVLEQRLVAAGFAPEIFTGEFDNYAAELNSSDGPLIAFKPELIIVLPAVQRCRYHGSLVDDRVRVEKAAAALAEELLAWCQAAHGRSGAEFLIANYPLPSRDDLGAFRVRAPGSDWTFRKLVNLELGLRLPPFARICDVEFLCHRLGGTACENVRGWFESKQPGSPRFLMALASELEFLIQNTRRAAKKVLVTDLDNTLWGGVLADDGMEGIELGDTSARAEAFKQFQLFLKSLKQRGVLLAICSKNEESIAREALERHPEMVLRAADFVNAKINWQPKPDNLRAMARELELGLDSFVFVDDNPAEIEIVRQFTPEVQAILLGPDPADYIAVVQNARCFEPRAITYEDTQRSEQYRAEGQRNELRATTTDLDAYLRSLEMTGIFRPLEAVDAGRLSQLTQRTNQFNLTTRRRTEAEILELAGRPDVVAFSFRLRDRFGDHGLVSLMIGRVQGDVLEVDTWLMSCRVLNRDVEESMLNELVRRATARGCTIIRGVYIPTAKNIMVRDLYTRLGFSPGADEPARREWTLPLTNYLTRVSRIHIEG